MLHTLHPGNQQLQRLGNVPEERAREKHIRKHDRQQQRHTDRTEVHPEEHLKFCEHRLVLLECDVHFLQAQADLRQVHRLEHIQRDPGANEQQRCRNQQRNKEHINIGAAQPLFDGHIAHLALSISRSRKGY